MEDILIRKATLADLQIIQKLNAGLCAKENRDYDPTIDAEYPLSKVGEEYFKMSIESKDSLALIAECDNEIAGYLIGAIMVPEDYRTIKKMAELENMYVEDAFRGKSIGTKLTEHFEKWCLEKGAERILYIASAGNTDAIRFYKRQGAEEISLMLEKKIK